MARREERNNRAAGWTRRAYYASELPCRASKPVNAKVYHYGRWYSSPWVEPRAGNLITDNFASRRTWASISNVSFTRRRINLLARRIKRFKSGLIFDGFGGRIDFESGLLESISSNWSLVKKNWDFDLGTKFVYIFEYFWLSSEWLYLLFVWCKVCAPNRIVKYSNRWYSVKFSGMMRFN